MKPYQRCEAVTPDGNRCKNRAWKGTGYCFAHRGLAVQQGHNPHLTPWERLQGWWNSLLRRYWPLAVLIFVVSLIVFSAGPAYNAWTGKPALDLPRELISARSPEPLIELNVRFVAPCERGCDRIVMGNWKPRIQRENIVTDDSDVLIQIYGAGRVIATSGWNKVMMPEDLVPEATELIPACIGERSETSPVIELGITNKSTHEWLRVERTVLARITRVDVFDGPVHVFHHVPQGGGMFFRYALDLRPSMVGRETTVKPLDDSLIPDFYELQRNKPEWFAIFPSCLEPGIFTLQLGATYIDQGTAKTVWSKNEVAIRSPRRYYLWDLYPTQQYALSGLLEWSSSTKTWQYVSKPTVADWVVP